MSLSVIEAVWEKDAFHTAANWAICHDFMNLKDFVLLHAPYKLRLLLTEWTAELTHLFFLFLVPGFWFKKFIVDASTFKILKLN